eukprot:scaffold52888_cov70-Phaeocystis_antarctica.AAC.27
MVGAGEGDLADAACLFGRRPQLVLSVGAAQPKQAAPQRVCRGAAAVHVGLEGVDHHIAALGGRLVPSARPKRAPATRRQGDGLDAGGRTVELHV